MAKIVHMTSVHVPFDTRVFHKECRTLREAGHEVVLLATHDRSEVVDGIRVVGFPRRSRTGRMLRTTIDIYRQAVAEDADVYHFHDPELLPVGWALARKRRRIIWDSHEDVTRQLLDKEWLPTFLRRPAAILAGTVERWCSNRFAAVISAEPTGAPRFRHHRVSVIQNWPRLDEFVPAGDDYASRAPNVVYVGAMTEARGLPRMVDAINVLPAELGARLQLAGTFGPPEMREEASRRDRHGRVSVLGQLSRPDVKGLLAGARVGLVVLDPTPQFIDAQPVKLFEYMAAGVPFVASDFPVWRALGGEASGLYVDPLDPSALAEAISWLLRHPQEAAEMGRQGRMRVESQFSWEAEGRKLMRLYDDVLGDATFPEGVEVAHRQVQMSQLRRRVSRIAKRARTAIRSPRNAMAVVRRDARSYMPGVLHAGFRSACRIRRVGSHDVFEKAYKSGSDSDEALANEILARKLFESKPWLVPIVRAEDRTIALPRLPEDRRLDLVAPNLSDDERRDVARRAVAVAFDIFQQGYAHRDFHAQNMFWVRGQLLVVDFEGLAPYPSDARPAFPSSYDLTAEGLPSPFTTNSACYASASPKSLQSVLGISLEEALEAHKADLLAEGTEVSRTFKRGAGRHHCLTENIYGSFDIPHFRVSPEDAQRSSEDRFTEFGITTDGLSGQSVLDLGSNTGGMLFEAWKRGASSCLGIEYDADKVRWSEKVTLYAGIGGTVRFRQADIDLLIADELGSFDVVLCLAIERHVQNSAALMALLGRVCKGQLLFEGNSTTDIAWVESMLRKEGFANIRILGPSRSDVLERNRNRELLVASK